MERIFELRTIVVDKNNRVQVLAVMDLETYNDALANFIEHVQDDYFNDGFRAGNNYPSEEELADMDHDRTSDDS